MKPREALKRAGLVIRKVKTFFGAFTTETMGQLDIQQIDAKKRNKIRKAYFDQ